MTYISLMSGKLIGSTIRLMGVGGGSTLPGRIAIHIDRDFIPALAGKLVRGTILITGTNGKTTTSSMLAGVLSGAGYPPVHNRTGANLLSGIASSLVRDSDLKGRPRGDIGLFEVDEAVMPSAVKAVSPDIVLITNLFRDQLDRYGELDSLAEKMRGGLEYLPADATVLLNSDDPLVADIGRGLDRKVVYFGIESEEYSSSEIQHAADSEHCSRCGSPYIYGSYLFGHMGKYRCPQCGHRRPEPQVYISSARLRGMRGTEADITFPGGKAVVRSSLSGLYNLYNLLAAFACALELGMETEAVVSGIRDFSAAFGRQERIEVGGRSVHILLAKNPAGFNEVVRTLSLDDERKYMILALNDNIADGRDVSWIWDADIEPLCGNVAVLTASGTRAQDMALRAKYAELDEEELLVDNDLGRAFERSLELVPEGGELYVVPTYTAMLGLRKYLSRKGLVAPFWSG